MLRNLQNKWPPHPVEESDYYEDYFNFYGTEDDEDKVDEEIEGDDKVDDLPKDIYCDIVETLADKCGEFSLLEIWNYDREIISKLSEQDIIDAINSVDESPVFGYSTNYTDYLGQVEYNSSGHVVGAKSIRSIWLEQFDPKKIPESSLLVGFESDQADPFTVGYEEEVLKVMWTWKNEREQEGKGYSFNMNLGLSFNAETSRPIQDDLKRQIFGYILMFSYALLSLGKLNVVEIKIYLAAAGILAVYFGLQVSIGLTMALGYAYTPLTGIIPFICLGIGIDDMFVIVRCFNNIPEDEMKRNGLIKNMGTTMKHAGASITVTSLTDICAFGTAAMTVFPSLKSLCVSAAIAIGAIYLFQTSWFIAWMVLDQRRVEQKRNGFVPIVVHKDWQPPKWTQKDVGKIMMTKMAKLMRLPIFQGCVLLLTMAALSFGIWGTYNIKVHFILLNILPDDSYMREWFDQNKIDFPSDGYGVEFYTQDVSYIVEDFDKIERIISQLDNLTQTHDEWIHYGKKLPQIVQTPWKIATGFWWTDLKKFISDHKAVKDWREALVNGHFPMYLSDFLHHEEGSMYTNNFRFAGNMTCNVEAPHLTAAKLGTLQLRDLEGPGQHLPAQHAINSILSKANLSNTTFAYGIPYPAWEIDEILARELWVNLSTALVCVFLIVFITLADVCTCLLILSCVLFTMVDVLGLIYLLGMTLDPLTLICNIVGVGLSVDYGAHIAHAYIISKGSKEDRTCSGFISISPAVLHGGISTILALTPTAYARDELYRNRSSRKTDFNKRKGLLKIH